MRKVFQLTDGNAQVSQQRFLISPILSVSSSAGDTPIYKKVYFYDIFVEACWIKYLSTCVNLVAIIISLFTINTNLLPHNIQK